ncbi:MAG: PD-(D/E)XK nuclease family protein [Geodermatophilaceae bacterium]|nr:PD-(D/E)XK nuclease family protein [Geodermatophilaceae bacterium]
MPARLFACTPSRLATFTDCPRRYRMTYLDRPAPGKGPPWAHNSVGAAVHTALKQWWDLPPARRTPPSAGALLDAVWLRDGFRDDAQCDQWRASAREWLIRYVSDLDPAEEPPGVERTVAATTLRLALSGRVDRIDRRGEELVVVDYKTGRWVPDEDDARGSQALAMYVLGARRTFHAQCRRVELHHVPTGTIAAFEHSEESLARHVGRAEDTAVDIVTATAAVGAGGSREEAFPPRTGGHCGWCDVRRHCPEGQRAAPAREPWAALRP